MIQFRTIEAIPIMDNQRLLLYAALAVVMFLIWQAWQEDQRPKPPVPPKTADQVQSEPTADKMPSDTPDVPQIAEPSLLPTPKYPAEEEHVKVFTDLLAFEISTKGGDIVRGDLLTYPVSIKKPNLPFRLLDKQDRLYVAQSGLIHDRTAQNIQEPSRLAPSHHALYHAEKKEYHLEDGTDQLQVPLVWKSSNGITVRKIYTFHRDRFLIDIEHVVINEGHDTWVGRQYRQLRHGEIRDEDISRLLYTYTGSAYFDGKYEKLAFEDMADEPLSKEIKGGWVAILQHYFVSAWVPKPEETSLAYTKVINAARGPEHIIGLRSESQTIAPSETASFHSQLFVGPKLQHRLEDIGKGLDLVTDYGIFTVISQPLFWLLEWLYSWLGNWGWAIIVLTLLIKLAFYKLSETSYRSMARMRAVQPRLVAIKERHGSDKQRMNQALMDLYKKEKINPLGGCLPIVIQIPVFIALYWVLLESVELRQAPFIFWIKDLSTKDPYFVLPLLMGVTMVIQQKLNPAPLDPVQAKVMMILPVAFTVFFAFFPSGLVLYWFINNLLSIAQQWMITRRIEQASH